MATPLANRRVNTWRQHQSMGQGHDQHIWVGALTGGERGPAESSEGPQRGAGEELRGGLPNLQSSPASRPQTSLQDALGDLNSPAN